MQNRYTGDIGDFGKYALLNALVGNELRLGINWYLNPDEEGNRDGGFVAYSQLRSCDPSLHDALMEIIRRGDRCVGAVERGAILPPQTVFYSAPLTFRDLPTFSTAARRARRDAWLECALRITAPANLIFMDPDNGLAGKSASATSNAGQKYVFMEELEAFIARGQSVIVYHHQTREKGGLLVQVERRLAELRNICEREPWAMVFRRRSVRVYFVVPSALHEAALRVRAEAFIAGPWGAGKNFYRVDQHVLQ